MKENKKFKFTQGQRVYFELGPDVNGFGKVCGELGFVIIIEPEHPLPNYPFTHTYLVEAQIKEPPQRIPFMEKKK